MSHFTLSRYKTTNISWVYSVFSSHAFGCANLLFSDHLFLHFSWNSFLLVFFVFMVGVMSSLLSFVCCFQSVCFTFQPSKFYPSVALERWWWAFRMREVDNSVTIVITFFHRNNDPGIICVQGGVIVCSVSRSWMLPIRYMTRNWKLLCWSLTVCSYGFL